MKVLHSKSGLTILFRKMKTRLVDMQFVARVGAMDEQPDTAGYCHALEHMLFAGTKNRTWEQVNKDWEKLGAYYNAHTFHDRTTYEVNCLKEHWEAAFEVLADIFFNPTFPSERWEEIEKHAVVSEIQGAEDIPEYLLEEELFIEGLGEKYHPILGSLENIREASMDDLSHFYYNYYCGDNLVLLISGNLTEKQILRAVNKYSVPRDQNPPSRPKFQFDFNYDTVNIEKDGLEQAHIMLAKPLPIPKTLKGKAALDLAVKCMQQYLFEELRERRGLCYGVACNIYYDIPDNYFLQVHTATDNDRFELTKETLASSIAHLGPAFTKERVRNMVMAEKHSTVAAMDRTVASNGWMWDAYEENIEGDPFEVHLDILDGLSDSYVRGAAIKNDALRGAMKLGKIVDEVQPGLWAKIRSLF